MKKNVWYIVTKKSTDGTFEVGDHIKFEIDGTILCREAQGWIDIENVQEAIKGMEYKLDIENIKKKINCLEAELKELNDLLQ